MTTILALFLVAGTGPMAATETRGRSFQSTRSGAGAAERLVADGSKDALARAEKILEAVLACQESRPGHAHCGNFLWNRDDQAVEDLNAVEFVLSHLIPMMIEHGDRLSPEMRKRVLQSIRIGLEEIKKLDVLVAYTNITSLDILTSCLGGELLKDRAIAERGYKKLIEWTAFTDQSGIVYEYNSPTYASVTIGALSRLIDLVRHEPTRVRARTMVARLGLSVALHIHTPTGRWAGPHSRAYYNTVGCQGSPEIEGLKYWVAEGTLPDWIPDTLEGRPTPMDVAETAYAPRDIAITTHHSRSFALGVVSKSTEEFEGQSNVMYVHYTRKNSERPGTFYTRYLINDKWLGDTFRRGNRTTNENLFEEGRFIGVQDGARAIGLYTLPNRIELCSSLKAALIWSQREGIEEILIDGRRVESLPADVSACQNVVVNGGDVLFAVRPLAKTDLGCDAPTRLVEIAGHLVLEISNYRGPEKAFWDLIWPGAFYKGVPQCGFVVELAERSEYPSAQAFARTFAEGKLTDRAQPATTYRGESERLWTVEYSRGGRSLGLEVDLMQWNCKRRWTDRGDVGYPMLESPMARETRTGRVVIGDAVLTCGKAAAWLFANPEKQVWVAGYHGLDAAPLTLTLPHGKVEIKSMTTGTVAVKDRVVTIESVGQPRRQVALLPR